MKEKLQKLIAKFKLKPNSYYQSDPYTGNFPKISPPELQFLENWQCRTKKGWYGISIGQPAPDSWFLFLNEFLKLVEKDSPKFEILQIKMKFGGIRIYLDNVSENVNNSITEVEKLLCDKFLIY